MSRSRTHTRFINHKEAREAGWFSRRHQNSEAHIEAKRKREAKQVAKLERAARKG